MKKIILIVLLAMVFVSPAFAQVADVTILVTKSLDDPTPRSSVFPASMSPAFKHYVVEQNGTLLPGTCASLCPSVTITGLSNGTYSFRIASVVEITWGGQRVLTYGWSAPKSVVVNCAPPVMPTPSAPVFTSDTTVCK